MAIDATVSRRGHEMLLVNIGRLRHGLPVHFTQAPSGLLPQARYAGRYYAVADTPWDHQAFSLLYQAFQMTVTDVSGIGVPITISK